ncbi:MAG TPA: hypothetical protein VM223_02790 [Planctomycetota bacterium]|nr:hypothetical protein [Planctomycetota bacterium]
MAIYTPTGLKIRLRTEYAFALMARLYPRVDAFRVLKTTEGIELVPTVEAVSIALLCFITGVPPLYTAAFVFGARVFATIRTLRRLGFATRMIVGIGTLFSYVDRFGLSTIGLAVIGFATGGWQLMVGYLSGRILGSLVSMAIEGIYVRRAFQQFGEPLTASEWHFFIAYGIHAERLGVTTNIRVSEDELDESNWRGVFLDLASKWPEVVARFTPE